MNRTRARATRAPTPHGFTLIELMVTIFVAAILLAIAVPSFKHIIKSTHLSGASNDLLATLKYARTEAVSRGQQIAVNASSSGQWDDGWQAVAPAASAGTDVMLRRHEPLRDGYTIAITPNGTTRVSFDSQGGSTLDHSTCFTLAADDTSAHTAPSHIEILPSGAIHSVSQCTATP